MSDPGGAADRLARVRERIAQAAARSGRDAGAVRLVAVTKKRPLELVRALMACGQLDLAENRVQELRERAEALGVEGAAGGRPVWHLIGTLQRNKAKYLSGVADWVHSLESVELAEALSKAYGGAGATVRVLVQVNVSGEATKGGVEPEAAAALVRQAMGLPALRVEGLMTMAPFEAEAEATRPVFRALRELRDRIERECAARLPHLSMGMSNDYEVAVEEGATLVRIGTALFSGE